MTGGLACRRRVTPTGQYPRCRASPEDVELTSGTGTYRTSAVTGTGRAREAWKLTFHVLSLVPRGGA